MPLCRVLEFLVPQDGGEEVSQAPPMPLIATPRGPFAIMNQARAKAAEIRDQPPAQKKARGRPVGSKSRPEAGRLGGCVIEVALSRSDPL
jgi:hypothetical protein